jgi:hypothetical protein
VEECSSCKQPTLGTPSDKLYHSEAGDVTHVECLKSPHPHVCTKCGARMTSTDKVYIDDTYGREHPLKCEQCWDEDTPDFPNTGGLGVRGVRDWSSQLD